MSDSEPVTVKDEPVTVKSEPVTVNDEPVTVKDEPVTVKNELEEYHKDYLNCEDDAENDDCDSDCGVSAISHRRLSPIFSRKDFQWQDGTLIVPVQGRLAKRGRPMARVEFDQDTGTVQIYINDYPLEGRDFMENPDFWLELTFQLPTQKKTRTDLDE